MLLLLERFGFCHPARSSFFALLVYKCDLFCHTMVLYWLYVTGLVTLTAKKGQKMKKSSVCEMCHNPLPPFSKGYLCSTACRKAKSRLKLDAGRNMIAARNHIRAVIKGLELDVISSRDSYDDYTDLLHILETLRIAHNERYERELTALERLR